MKYCYAGILRKFCARKTHEYSSKYNIVQYSVLRLVRTRENSLDISRITFYRVLFTDWHEPSRTRKEIDFYSGEKCNRISEFIFMFIANICSREIREITYTGLCGRFRVKSITFALVGRASVPIGTRCNPYKNMRGYRRFVFSEIRLFFR